MEQQTPSQIGRRIAQLRIERAWSQGELARRAEITQGMISHLESGARQDLGTEAARRIARALGVTLDALLTEEIAA